MIPEDLKKPKKGGRPAAHSIMLDQDEFDWAQRNLAKKALLVPIAKDSSKKLRECILSLNDKLVIPPGSLLGEGHAVKMSRDELQVFNELVTRAVQALRDKVLPEYAKRHTTSQRQVEAFATYSMLLDLEAKGKRIYDEGSHRRGNRRVSKP